MRINANVLLEFVKKATLNGKIITALLDFKPEGIKTNLQQSNIAAVTSTLSSKAFLEYESIGEVGIKNTGVFMKILTRYADKPVKLLVEQNFFKIVGESGSAYLTLCEKSFIDNFLEKEINPTYESSVLIKTNKFKEMSSCAGILATREVKLNVESNKLSIIVESESSDSITETVDFQHADVKTKFGDLLISVFEVVGDEASLSLKTDFPCRLVEKSINSEFRFIVAPMDVE